LPLVYHPRRLKDTKKADNSPIYIFLVCKPQWEQWQGSCYKVFMTLMTWPDAVSTCNIEGSNLTSVSRLEESNFLRNLVKSTISDSYIWIGLNDIAQEGTYEWIDGSQSTYRNWDSTQPSDPGAIENCVDLSIQSGVWYDFGCTNVERYVCKYVLQGK
jgi:hypothetical protein